ncbi:MAG: RNA-binding cell elongation regulator Jag/EloR [bacterium]
MSDAIESQGKTVEEAVSEALLKMGARRDEVEVVVLEEGKPGFLGLFGTKMAKVEVRRKERSRERGRSAGAGAPRKDTRRPARPTPESKPPAAQAKSRQAAKKPGKSQEEQPRTRQRSPQKPERRDEPRPAATVDAAQISSDAIKAASKTEVLRGVAESDVPATLEKITTELLGKAGFTCRCEIVEGDYHMVKVVTDNNSAGVLIGRHGTTVDAVEHIVERMSSQAAGARVNMNLDINNYRRRREESLIERAQGLAAKVTESGREIHMEPLCARERRIIHLEIAQHSGLRTFTIATSSGKHVIIAKDQDKGNRAPSPGLVDGDNGAPEERALED